MGVTIHWKPLENAAKVNLYQSVEKFGLADIATKQNIVKTELPADTVSKEVMIPRNTVNFFVVSGIDEDGLETFGEVFSFGNFPNTGPGPDTIKRGTWEFGWFGELKPEELFTAAELGAALNSQGYQNNINPANLTIWNKCIVNGKIIFIPTKALYRIDATSSQATALAQRGLDMTPGFPKAPVFNKNGNDFIYRLPLASKTRGAGGPFYPSVDDDIKGSELGMLMSCYTGGAGRFTKVAPDPVSGGYHLIDQFNDNNAYPAESTDGGFIGSANWYAAGANSTWQIYGVYPQDTSTPSWGVRSWFWSSYVSLSTWLVQPILELAF